MPEFDIFVISSELTRVSPSDVLSLILLSRLSLKSNFGLARYHTAANDDKRVPYLFQKESWSSHRDGCERIYLRRSIQGAACDYYQG
jgi:hypothetical protein